MRISLLGSYKRGKGFLTDSIVPALRSTPPPKAVWARRARILTAGLRVLGFLRA